MESKLILILIFFILLNKLIVNKETFNFESKENNFNCRYNRKLCFGKNIVFSNLTKKQLVLIYRQLKNSNLICYLSGGTLLGIIRENNLLRNDDDLDITIFPKSLECFRKVENIFKNNGYHKKTYFMNSKYGKLPGQYTFKKKINNYIIEIDICFIWSDPVHNKFVLMSFWNDNGEFYIFNPFKLKNIIFYNNNFMVPENEKLYLVNNYGKNWKIEKSNFKYQDYSNIKYKYNINNLEFHSNETSPLIISS